MSSAAVPGSSLQSTSARPIATGATSTSGAATSDSVSVGRLHHEFLKSLRSNYYMTTNRSRAMAAIRTFPQ